MYRYARATDWLDTDNHRDVFVEDCVFASPHSGDVHGIDAVVEWMNRALAPIAATQHLIGNISITFTGDDSADAVSYVQAWHRFRDESRADMILWGEYHDRWVRLDGTWRELPGRMPSLDTADGSVAIRLADDLRPPVPGSPVSVFARLDDDGLARAVSSTVRGPPSGAWIDRWGLAAAKRVGELVHPERRGLVKALVLGDKSDLAWPLKRACIASTFLA